MLWGAFGTTGQRCTATSRLILHRKVHDRFLRRLVDAAEASGWATAATEKTDVGPLIHEAAAEKVERYVDIGQEAGRRARHRRQDARRAGSANGWFYRPTVFAGVQGREPARAGGDLRSGAERRPGRLVRRGGPGQQRRALRPLELASTPRDVNLAFRAMQELDNGITYVNAPTIGAEAHLPFGGVKADGQRPPGRRAGRSTSSTRRPRSATWTTPAGCSAPRSTPTTCSASRARRVRNDRAPNWRGEPVAPAWPESKVRQVSSLL